MNNSKHYFKLVLAVTLFGALFYALMAYEDSIRELLNISKANEDDNAQSALQGIVDTNENLTAVPGTDANTAQAPVAFSFEEMEHILSLVNNKQRKNILDDEEKFKNFILNEAIGKSVYAAAVANKIDKNERNQLLAKRGAENILREIYIRQIAASKIPKDFPTEEQIDSYYEKNKEKFVVGDRLPVWQIFLPITENMSQKDTELLKKQAESIASDLAKGDIDFTTAALRYSAHKESKYNGGFMGTVLVTDIKPEILRALMAQPVDVISSPVTSTEGIHIMKRGAILAKQELKLEDARAQIKKALLSQANKELRNAIFRQAANTYPVEINDERIEEWRLKLIAAPQSDSQ